MMMRDGFLFGIGLILAIVLWPLLVRLAFFGIVLAVLAVIAVVCGAVVWSLWDNPGHALALALTFGWLPFVGLMFLGFDRFMVWLRNDPDRPKRAASDRSDRQRAERLNQEQERHRLERLGDRLWNLKQTLIPIDEIKRHLQEGEFNEEGFPKYFIRSSDTNWGEPLSYQTVRDNLHRVELAHCDPQPDNMQWCLTGMHYNNDEKLVCAHSGMPIVSYWEIEHSEIDASFRK
jgi:hypothetical protein